MFVGDYIFGYGSLIHPPGINGRGMWRQYEEKDLIECRLSAHQRCWNAHHKGELYLGLTRVPAIRETPINGVLFPIDKIDVEAFMSSEGSSSKSSDPVYELVDVTEHIHNFPPGTERVLTCVTRKPSSEGAVSMRYQHHIRRSLEHRGPEFAREFMETTDWNSFRYNTLYPNSGPYHLVISDWESMLVKEKQ